MGESALKSCEYLLAFQQNIFWSTNDDFMLTNSTKRQKIQVFGIEGSVKMVQRIYEERLAISQHYRVRGAQPICIHQQSCHIVNKCCLAENLMTKKFPGFKIVRKSYEVA